MGDSNTLLDDDYIIVDDSDTEEVEEVHTKMDTDEVQFIPKDNATIAEECKNLGNDNYKAQNYQSALKLYSDAISLCPDNPSYYGNRAACSMMLGNYKQALQDAQTSVRMDDKFEKGYVRIIKCCVVLGDIIGAEQAIMKLTKCDPLNSIIKSEQLNCQLLRQFEAKIQTNYEEKIFRTCVYLLDSALKIATACLKYKLIKAECLAFLGRIDEAGDIAVSAMKIDSTSADAIYVRGLCLYYNDNLEKGVLHFERALKLDPDHVKAKDMRIKSKSLKEKKEKGNLLYKSGKYREALQLYTEALEIDPYNTDMKSKLLYNRALVNSKLRLTNDAVADCSNVLNINSAYLKALLLRARCYSELEKFDECVRDYESALNIQRTSEIKVLLREAKFALKKSKRKDYYKILGISKNASLDEIKKAYRKKALAHHPDRHASSSEADKKDQELKFKEIGEAYEILADPVKKQRFDSGQDFEEGNQHEMDPNAMFKQFFQFSSSGGGPNVYNFQF